MGGDCSKKAHGKLHGYSSTHKQSLYQYLQNIKSIPSYFKYMVYNPNHPIGRTHKSLSLSKFFILSREYGGLAFISEWHKYCFDHDLWPCTELTIDTTHLKEEVYRCYTLQRLIPDFVCVWRMGHWLFHVLPQSKQSQHPTDGIYNLIHLMVFRLKLVVHNISSQL